MSELLTRAVIALRDPAGFFQWLRAQPSRLPVAYSIFLIQSLASSAVGVAFIRSGSSPEAEQTRSLLESFDVSADLLLIGALVVAPVAALVAWLIAWLPVRIGAGRVDRLWEVAAWSQLPILALVPMQAIAALGVGGNTPGLMSSVAIAGLAWSTWFVYTGVRDLSSGNAVRATVIYALFWGIPQAIGLFLGQSGSSPSGTFAV